MDIKIRLYKGFLFQNLKANKLQRISFLFLPRKNGFIKSIYIFIQNAKKGM